MFRTKLGALLTALIFFGVFTTSTMVQQVAAQPDEDPVAEETTTGDGGETPTPAEEPEPVVVEPTEEAVAADAEVEAGITDLAGKFQIWILGIVAALVTFLATKANTIYKMIPTKFRGITAPVVLLLATLGGNAMTGGATDLNTILGAGGVTAMVWTLVKGFAKALNIPFLQWMVYGEGNDN